MQLPAAEMLSLESGGLKTRSAQITSCSSPLIKRLYRRIEARGKKLKTELVRVAPQMDLATLDALIQKRVAEATANRGAILEPWFQSKAVADAIRRHQNIFHVRKWFTSSATPA